METSAKLILPVPALPTFAAFLEAARWFIWCFGSVLIFRYICFFTGTPVLAVFEDYQKPMHVWKDIKDIYLFLESPLRYWCRGTKPTSAE